MGVKCLSIFFQDNKKHYHLCKAYVNVDKNWLEGFAIEHDFSTSLNTTSFVYGVYVPDASIDFFLALQNRMIHFHGVKEIESFRGKITFVGPFSEVIGGDSSLKVLNHISYSISDVTTKADICKGTMDDNNKYFYEKIYSHMQDFIILSTYQNQTYHLFDIIDRPEVYSKYVKIYQKQFIFENNHEKSYNQSV